jgi:hypothetical protein
VKSPTTLLDLDGIARRLVDPSTGRRLTRTDLAWRTELPEHRYEYEAGGRREPVWDWWNEVVPFLIATRRSAWLRNHAGYLAARRAPGNLPTFVPVPAPRARGGGVIPGTELSTMSPERAWTLVASAERQHRRAVGGRDRTAEPSDDAEERPSRPRRPQALTLVLVGVAVLAVLGLLGFALAGCDTGP